MPGLENIGATNDGGVNDKMVHPSSRTESKHDERRRVMASGASSHRTSGIVSASPFRKHGQLDEAPHTFLQPADVDDCFVLEVRNDLIGRAVRVSQKDIAIMGPNRVQTRIEVIDTMLEGSPVVLSIKHAHSNTWGRQIMVHKNLLMACQLAGVESPLEIPTSSKRLYEQTENIAHIHTYMERLLPHIRVEHIPDGIAIFWWRAAGNGSIVIQNLISGRMIVTKSRSKSIPDAVFALERTLDIIRDLPPIVFEKAEDYPTSCSPEEVRTVDVEGNSYLPDLDSPITTEEVATAVDRWSLEDRVSPWLTNHIVKVPSTKRSIVTHCRYSIGIDPGNAEVICGQVHANEPLSRELKAFPVAMLPMAMKELTWRETRLTYKRSVWFLKKLQYFHEAHEIELQEIQMSAKGNRRDDRCFGNGRSPNRTPGGAGRHHNFSTYPAAHVHQADVPFKSM